MTRKAFHIDVDCVQMSKDKYQVCGDAFLSRKLKDVDRTIVLLSDGLGSGIKANVLATLTASMAVNFTLQKQSIERTSKIIMSTLPVDKHRQISYATFTIADIESNGVARIVEFENPPFQLFRQGKRLEFTQCELTIDGNQNKGRKMHLTQFELTLDDRIVITSDGVTQSGIGSASMPFGYGDYNLTNFIEKAIEADPEISAYNLANKVVKKAFANDIFKPKDDISCAVIHFRKPRKMLICSGPPYDEAKDKTLAAMIATFQGKKVICGGTTSQIVARELQKEIEISLNLDSSGLPPASKMEGIDLVTEGILTIGKVADLLEKNNNIQSIGVGPAADIFKMLMISDEINLIVGTKINVAHQDPSLPEELEIRRNVVRKIAKLLEEKFLKEVHIQFI
ncbi:MAG TPA: stage II sporulation protein E [Bacteroidales bacterium]|nr:stage II sporulation protein E [Bacteroidales bacterium]